jgi:hypothetical protein
MVVLGLLIEKPGQSVAEIAKSLDERFLASRFNPATAHASLPQMARGGRLRPRVTCVYKAPGRGQKATDRYEPTREGVSEYRAWMHAVPREAGPPALREALYGRIELCTLEDLPDLIRIAREEASIARDMYSAASDKLNRHKEDERERIVGHQTDEDHLRKVRQVLLHISPQHWAARNDHMKEVRRLLQKIATEAGIPLTAAD